MEEVSKTGSLFIFSGLSASGKSTLARKLAAQIRATYLRIDTIENGLKNICLMNEIKGEGYRLSYLIAQENLACGNHVIADSVNPWELTRIEWNSVATSIGAKFINIEIACSDQTEHKKRFEGRELKNKSNTSLLTWDLIINRDYQEWNMPRVYIDTARKSEEHSFKELIQKLELSGES